MPSSAKSTFLGRPSVVQGAITGRTILPEETVAPGEISRSLGVTYV